MRENKFQSSLIKKLKTAFPGSLVLKNDPTYTQGIPDLLVLHKNRWAALEVKANKKAHKRPNQDYYISKMKDMSFASFISPENESEVLYELEQFFDG